MDLQQGANAPVSGGTTSVRLEWRGPSGVPAVASAYLLTASGTARSAQDIIFHRQRRGANGAVEFVPNDGVARFNVDLAALPEEIDRIVFCMSVHDAGGHGRTLGLLRDASIAVDGELRFCPSLAGASEAAMVLGELYRRNGAWKFRAVGQGYDGGIGPLARSFGIDLGDVPQTVAPAAEAPSPVSLSKVTLEKRGQTVSLEKRGSSFGEITVNLNWSRARGLFIGRAIDLDLGCLFELSDGSKGAVQALGNAFGAFDSPPYIELSGDDRTGDAAEGETLHINGAFWSEVRRVCVFASIYDGAPNWDRTDGVVLVTMPGQPPIEVRMTEGRNDKRLCGIVMLENEGGRLKATRLVEYVRDQAELDRRHDWGLRWVPGRKD